MIANQSKGRDSRLGLLYPAASEQDDREVGLSVYRAIRICMTNADSGKPTCR